MFYDSDAYTLDYEFLPETMTLFKTFSVAIFAKGPGFESNWQGRELIGTMTYWPEQDMFTVSTSPAAGDLNFWSGPKEIDRNLANLVRVAVALA